MSDTTCPKRTVTDPCLETIPEIKLDFQVVRPQFTGLQGPCRDDIHAQEPCMAVGEGQRSVGRRVGEMQSCRCDYEPWG